MLQPSIANQLSRSRFSGWYRSSERNWSGTRRTRQPQTPRSNRDPGDAELLSEFAGKQQCRCAKIRKQRTVLENITARRPSERRTECYSRNVYPPRDRSTTAASGKDFYQVLNVARKASTKEIHRSYRTLARKYHPDLNPGNQAAAQKFREIQEAYEVLGDPRTRKAYDYYGPNFEHRVPVRTAAPSSQPSVSRAKPAARADTARNAASMFETPQFYRSLGGYRHLTPYARLGSVTVALVFMIGTFLYLLLPNSGVREFKLAKEALQHVTSWKMQSPAVSFSGAGSDYFYEVSCPSSARTIQHLRLPGPASEMTLETVIVGSDRYMYNDRAKAWTHDVAARGPADACDNLHRAQDAPSLPPLNRWLGGMYVIEKQKLRDAPDGDCREWRIVGPGGFSAVPSAEFVCLGVKDHLPRFQGVPGSTQEVRFYDWNVPVEIVAPDLTASP